MRIFFPKLPHKYDDRVTTEKQSVVHFVYTDHSAYFYSHTYYSNSMPLLVARIPIVANPLVSVTFSFGDVFCVSDCTPCNRMREVSEA
jgi:hypothetical protein